MAEMPKSVAVSIELNDETVQQIKQLIREEMAMFAADALTAAVDRRDRWRISELNTDCVYRYACPHCGGDFWFDKSERMQRFALLHGKAHRD